MSKYTIDKLEQMNKRLAKAESDAHNKREKVLGLIKLKREARESDMKKEELEVLESNIEKLEKEI